MNLQIQEVSVNKIRPDKAQPRQQVDREYVKQMAISMKSEGVINPIEIDSSGMIVTGEMRWRAACAAGLKTIPCKVYDVTGHERFFRQIVENLHHNTMNPLDTARAIKKTVKIKEAEGKETEGAIKWVSQTFGIDRRAVYRFLLLLKSSTQIQEAVANGVTVISVIDSLNSLPEDIRKGFEKKIINGELKRAGVRLIASAVRRRQDLFKEILALDYTDKDEREIEDMLCEISTDLAPVYRQMREAREPAKEISNLIIKLNKLLQENPPEHLGKFYVNDIFFGLETTQKNITRWKRNQTVELPPAPLQIETKKLD